MHSVAYRYKPTSHGALPIVPVTVLGPVRALRTFALVDSGASVSIFGSVVAEQLGVDLLHARRACGIAADGFSIPYKIARIPLTVGGTTFRARIGFSNRLNIGFNLLGRLDVFKRFDNIVFKEKKKVVEFRKR